MVNGFVPTTGSQLYFEAIGHGPPVIFVHAGFLDRRMWSPQFEHYATEFQSVRYDVRGFGESPAGTEPYRDADDARELIAHLGLDHPVLVGCSNGGRIALDLALAHPRLVRALVLVAPGVAGYTPGTPEESRWLEEFDRAERPPSEMPEPGRIEYEVEFDLTHYCAAQSPQDLRELRAIARTNVPRTAAADRPRQSSPDGSAFAHLASLHLPTLVLLGARDVAGVRRIGERIAERIPGARVKVLANADHIINRSAGPEFDEALLPFLRAVAPAPGAST